MTEPQPPRAAPPPERQPVHVGPRAHAAGGVTAALSGMAHMLSEAGVVRGVAALARANQTRGFDCPGCAWPEPADRSHLEFCENGAKAIAAEATEARVDASFFSAYSVHELAERSDHWLNAQGRLTEPVVLRPGATHYAPIGWDEAFGLIADALKDLPTPDAAAFYTSGRTSNEAAFAYQRFVRELGTNNLPDCSNLCHESSGVAMSEAIGVGKGTVRLDDFEAADLILVIGQNPGTNHPRMLATLQAAARRGAEIVSINPLFEAGTEAFAHPKFPWESLSPTRLARRHVAVRVNGDVALFNGLAKALLALDAAGRGGVDRDFIAKHTVGLEALRAALDAQSWDAIVASSGVEQAEIEGLAERCAASRATIACWAMGLTQHRNAVANIQSVLNLLLLGGHIGRPGAGACPVRGHSNVQGDRTMGIWERPSAAFLDALEARCRFAPPRAHGYDAVDTIHAMERGAVRVFFAMGGNFLSAAPDTERTAAALRRCELTVAVSTKLNRGHLVTGATALILPCLARSDRDVQRTGEQFVTVEDSMSHVHASRGTLRPLAETLLSEVAIVARLARATFGGASSEDWESYEADYATIRADIAAVVPGFDDFEERVRRDGGFYLPNSARECRWATATGRATFFGHALPDELAHGDELLMMTLRSHDQYNTTVYGLDDRYRGVFGGRRVVFVNAEDARERGLEAGQKADLVAIACGVERRADGFTVVLYDVPRGCCATYFPEANPLVPLEAVAVGSNTPASKSIPVRLVPA
ncbi:MAG: FdhF/YdeP family oxidoreductase [Myxococcales bacterium]|nr:FdhF/YdeP family oxidoreductase [Myxococcales bacterium]MCB9533777.1 FdhF/YdeP family oxidoreductase [Myxococcales bacterium]